MINDFFLINFTFIPRRVCRYILINNRLQDKCLLNFANCCK